MVYYIIMMKSDLGEYNLTQKLGKQPKNAGKLDAMTLLKHYRSHFAPIAMKGRHHKRIAKKIMHSTSESKEDGN